jgi:hypothetical protein
MSIKLIDSLEPNGNFKLVDAEDISYTSTAWDGLGDVSSILQKLENTVFATPKMYVKRGDLLLNYDINPETPLAIAIPVILETPSLGDCRITVTKKPAGAMGSFSNGTLFTKPVGAQSLELGLATTISDTLYKIVAIDGQNKSFKYFIYDNYNSETGEYVNATEVENGIEVEIVTGLMSFKSDFADTAAKTIYLKDQVNEISYYFEHTYAKACLDKLLIYSVYAGTSTVGTPVATQTVSLSQALLVQNFAPASTTKLTDRHFSFTPTDNGSYTLKVELKVIEKNDGDGNPIIDNSAYVQQQYTLDVMPESTIFITDVTKYLNNSHEFRSNDYINISLIPKTSSFFDKGNGSITLIGELQLVDVYYGDIRQNTDKNGNLISYPSTITTFTANVTDGQEYTWNLGRLYLDNIQQDYKMHLKLKLTAEASYSKTQDPIYINFIVTNETLLSASYNTNGLMAYFDFSDTDYFDNATNTISNKVEADLETEMASYKLQVVNAPISSARQATVIKSTFYNANEQANREYVENIDCLTLSGASYAHTIKKGTNSNEYTVKGNPWVTFAEANNTYHYTFETRIKSPCTGILDAIALSLGYESNADLTKATGIDITFDQVDVKQAEHLQCDLIEDTWHHICITCNDCGDESDIQIETIDNYNSLYSLRIYIDGILTKICKLSSNKFLGSKDAPLVINGRANLMNNDISFSNHGTVSIQFIRMYNRPLSSTEVFDNYLSSLGSTELINYLKSKHNVSTAPVVYFVRNLPSRIKTNGGLAASDTQQTITQKAWQEKELVNRTFAELHQIKTKKSDDPSVHTSKNSVVNCSIYWRDETGDTIVDDVRYKCLPNVDVLLQGTSSLNYPVKNYQLKIYEDDINANKRNKVAVKPPYLSKDIEDDWITPSYIYTLKCDYMEQSHRNNAPTACYYQDRVLPAVMDYCQTYAVGKNLLHALDDQNKETVSYSPARRVTNDGKAVYRDAISGLPCIVYYLDNPNPDFVYDGANSSFNPKDGNMVYAGTYMFNVDKEGAQLGFELKTNETTLVNNQPANAVICRDKYGKIVDSAGNLLSETPDATPVDTYPCISYEGATNDNYSAAAFVPFEHQRTLLLKNLFDNAEESEGKKVFYLRVWDETKNQYKLSDDGSEFLSDSTTSELFETFEDFYAEVIEKDKITTPSADNRHFYGVLSKAEHDEAYGADEYAYLKATLEPRFAFADEEGLSDKTIEFKEATYTVIKNAIDWVYESVHRIETSIDTDRTTAINDFRQNFKNYFSFEYCLAYYLQLLTFTQVDNAGKNAMFDTWGDGRLYPRPYDMDTQMGLDNSGNDNMPVSAEVHYDLSPLRQSGAVIQASNWTAISDPKHARFRAYNTNRSYLWKSFGLYFNDEIKACYQQLRASGVYSADRIQQFVNKKTSDIISGKYYNDDAVLKYLRIKDTNGNATDAYYYCVNGDRKDRYYNFLKQRLIFLDSIFEYNSSTNGQIDIRADANTATSYIGLVPYSPQYSTIRVDSAASLTTLLDPSAKYLTNDQVTYAKGVKITVPTAGSNKNIYISGAGNLQAVHGLDTINTTVLQLNDAHKLAEIKLAGTSISTLTFGQNSYLTHLDLSNMSNLTTTINLSQCINLQYLDISNSEITGIILPPQSDLTYLNCSNSALTNLSLNGLANLKVENLKLDNCKKLTELTISDCPNLNSLYTTEEYTQQIENITKTYDDEAEKAAKIAEQVAKYFPWDQLEALTKISISGNCDKFKVVDLKNLPSLAELNITHSACETLICTDCAGTAFENLGLAQLKNLKTINLSGSHTTDGTKGNLILSKDCELTAVYLHSTSFGTVATDKDTPVSGTFDFSTLSSSNSIKSISLYSNVHMQKLEGLKFIGSLRTNAPSGGGFLSGCTALTTINNCNIDSGNNANCSYMFAYCKELQDITNTEFNFSKCSNAASLFMSCPKIKWASIDCVLKGLAKTEATELSLGAFLYSACTGSGDGYPEALPAKLSDGSPLLPDMTVTLSEAFIGSGFKTITPGTFDNLTRLKHISHIFGTNIYYLPESLFLKCSVLENANSAFARCPNLGDPSKWATVIVDYDETQSDPITTEMLDVKGIKVEATATAVTHLCNPDKQISWTYSSGSWRKDSLYYPPVIFTYNTKIFNSTTLTSIQGLFYNCSKLTMNPSSSHTLNEFFEPLTGLTTCVGAFAKCTNLDFKFSGEESIFKNCPNIEHIDALFFSSGLTKIPELIFTNSSRDFNYLTTARGLFANCLNLPEARTPGKNVIGSDFFRNAPNLEYIGNSASMDGNYNIVYTTHITCQGMFANTSVYFDLKALHPLTKLKDISGLFFAGKVSSGKPSSTLPMSAYTDGEDQGYYYYPKFWDSDEGVLAGGRIQLFDVNKDYSALSNIAYLFAGNPGVQGISSNIFEKLTAITNAQGAFMGCYNFNTTDLEKLTSGKAQLTNVKLMFANCTTLAYELGQDNKELFTNCSKLNNCCGMFFNSSISGEVPASMFNDCRATLADTSYMFAKCANLSHIGTGAALINNPKEYDNSEINHYLANHRESILDTFGTIEKFKANLLKPEPIYEQDVQDALNNWFGENSAFDRYKNYVYEQYYSSTQDAEGNTSAAFNNKLYQNGTAISVESIYAQCLASIDTSITVNYTKQDELKTVTFDSQLAFYFNNTKANITQPGLLSNCTNLTNVVYMFAGCTGLHGAIPADMFYFDNCMPHRNFKSLEGLFYCCYYLTCAKYINLEETLPDVIPGIDYSYSSNIVVKSSIVDDESSYICQLPRGGNYSKVYPCTLPAPSSQAIVIYKSPSDTTPEIPNYLVPKDWLKSLTYLTSVYRLFSNIGVARDKDGDVITLDANFTFTNVYELLQVPETLFSNQYVISNASELFKCCQTIGGTVFTAKFLQTSLANLTNVAAILEYALVTGMHSLFTVEGGRNTALVNVASAFHGLSFNGATVSHGDKCALFQIDSTGNPVSVSVSNLQKSVNYTAPEFWNRSKFSKITTDTSARSLGVRGQVSWSNSDAVERAGGTYANAASTAHITDTVLYEGKLADIPNYTATL